jgi:hypothetical protein
MYQIIRVICVASSVKSITTGVPSLVTVSLKQSGVVQGAPVWRLCVKTCGDPCASIAGHESTKNANKHLPFIIYLLYGSIFFISKPTQTKDCRKLHISFSKLSKKREGEAKKHPALILCYF